MRAMPTDHRERGLEASTPLQLSRVGCNTPETAVRRLSYHLLVRFSEMKAERYTLTDIKKDTEKLHGVWTSCSPQIRL